VAELDDQVGARERHPASLDVGAVEVLLHQQLRRVVAGLRAEDHRRVAVGGVLGVDEQRVAHAVLGQAEVEGTEGAVDHVRLVDRRCRDRRG
jgi:hypothetical protein